MGNKLVKLISMQQYLEPLKLHPGRVGAATIASLYFLYCLYEPYEWRLLDGVNLLIHEAGHPIFGIFGEFMMVLGGTLMQLIMPIAFIIYFFRERQFFSGSLVCFWLGHSLINVSIYAADAAAMNLPLIGNGDRIHDWNYMLSALNMLGFTKSIALLFRGAAIIVILASVGLSFYFAVKNPQSEEME